jgi:hypothetical protein
MWYVRVSTNYSEAKMKILSDEMSQHFKLSLRGIAIVAVLVLSTFLYLRHKIHDVIMPPHITLPGNDKEVVTYNENRHIITVTTPAGTTTAYSRNPTVEIRKDGTVKTDANKWGPEVRPFLGVGYSDTGRAYAGCQFLYFYQLDAAASFGWTADANKSAFQPMLSVAWNFWSNTSINVGANPLSLAGLSKPEIAVFLSVRL